ncbi:F-box only protein 36b [Odontesthes bonariensis]|uniref:F-box only protein 36b n=1 Tax=Odontesthes bonariensis TaxID=219752 RepID=UPI003F585E04
MASLLADPLFEISGRGPPPDKNFYHFSLNKSEVIWRWWKISPRTVDRYSKPGEQRESHRDFLDDTWLQSEVSVVFGQRVLQYTKALCKGHYDYLERLPDSLLLRIINCLELEDVGQLGRTSQRFKELCGSEEFWEQAVRLRCNTVPAEVALLALEVGWRSIFFTNKLHLQKLLSRRRLRYEEQQEGHFSDPDTQAEESANESSETSPVSGSEEESHPSTICLLCIGSDTGFESNSCCDVDPDVESDPDPDLEPASDSIELEPDPFMEGLRFCEVETVTRSSILSSGVGDCGEVSAKTPT